jgi:hypothetical protein
MWARNLLFFGVCTGVAAITAASLLPANRAAIEKKWPHAAAGDDMRTSIAAVDDALAKSSKSAGAVAASPVAPRAPDLAIARRMSLALTGTIPSLEEIRTFESQPEGERLARWLEHLLADRRYSDYVAERLARTYVGVDDGPFLIYRRRRFVAWLSDQLTANRPFDAMVRDVIASDGLWTDTPAVNFISVTITEEQSKRADENRLAGRVARAFLGVRLDCAQCHDHPFDPRWTQATFQGLAAFFGHTTQGFTGIHDVPGVYEVADRKTGQKQTVAPAVPFQAELLADHGGPRQRLAAWITNPKNRAFARVTVNRAWALMFGKPLVEPIDSIPPDGDAPPALDRLADDFIAHGYDWRRLIRVIAGTAAFQRDSRENDSSADASNDASTAAAKAPAAWSRFPLSRLRPEQVVGSLLQASRLHTIDQDSSILVQFGRAIGEKDFVRRYGDSGEDEFVERGETIPQRLLLMNGQLVDDKTRENLLANAATRIARLAPDDATAVETSYLAVLTRRPTAPELDHFKARLAGTTGAARSAALADLYWTLFNSTEFSWNH